jgi:hypothetical protein
MNEAILRRVFQALNAHGARYTLFGGLAVGALGLPRATKDIDLLIQSSPANVEAVVAALRSVFADPALDEITAAEMESYGLIRYGVADFDFVIDLTTRLGEAVRFETLESAELTFLGERVPVATPRALVRMKLAAGRPQDLLDVARLRAQFGEENS